MDALVRFLGVHWCIELDDRGFTNSTLWLEACLYWLVQFHCLLTSAWSVEGSAEGVVCEQLHIVLPWPSLCIRNIIFSNDYSWWSVSHLFLIDHCWIFAYSSASWAFRVSYANGGILLNKSRTLAALWALCSLDHRLTFLELLIVDTLQLCDSLDLEILWIKLAEYAILVASTLPIDSLERRA